jgi:hypothetical protein
MPASGSSGNIPQSTIGQSNYFVPFAAGRSVYNPPSYSGQQSTYTGSPSYSGQQSNYTPPPTIVGGSSYNVSGARSTAVVSPSGQVVGGSTTPMGFPQSTATVVGGKVVGGSTSPLGVGGVSSQYITKSYAEPLAAPLPPSYAPVVVTQTSAIPASRITTEQNLLGDLLTSGLITETVTKGTQGTFAGYVNVVDEQGNIKRASTGEAIQKEVYTGGTPNLYLYTLSESGKAIASNIDKQIQYRLGDKSASLDTILKDVQGAGTTIPSISSSVTTGGLGAGGGKAYSGEMSVYNPSSVTSTSGKGVFGTMNFPVGYKWQEDIMGTTLYPVKFGETHVITSSEKQTLQNVLGIPLAMPDYVISAPVKTKSDMQVQLTGYGQIKAQEDVQASKYGLPTFSVLPAVITNIAPPTTQRIEGTTKYQKMTFYSTPTDLSIVQPSTTYKENLGFTPTISPTDKLTQDIYKQQQATYNLDALAKAYSSTAIYTQEHMPIIGKYITPEISGKSYGETYGLTSSTLGGVTDYLARGTTGLQLIERGQVGRGTEIFAGSAYQGFTTGVEIGSLAATGALGLGEGGIAMLGKSLVRGGILPATQFTTAATYVGTQTAIGAGFEYLSAKSEARQFNLGNVVVYAGAGLTGEGLAKATQFKLLGSTELGVTPKVAQVVVPQIVSGGAVGASFSAVSSKDITKDYSNLVGNIFLGGVFGAGLGIVGIAGETAGGAIGAKFKAPALKFIFGTGREDVGSYGSTQITQTFKSYDIGIATIPTRGTEKEAGFYGISTTVNNVVLGVGKKLVLFGKEEVPQLATTEGKLAVTRPVGILASKVLPPEELATAYSGVARVALTGKTSAEVVVKTLENVFGKEMAINIVQSVRGAGGIFGGSLVERGISMGGKTVSEVSKRLTTTSLKDVDVIFYGEGKNVFGGGISNVQKFAENLEVGGGKATFVTAEGNRVALSEIGDVLPEKALPVSYKYFTPTAKKFEIEFVSKEGVKTVFDVTQNLPELLTPMQTTTLGTFATSGTTEALTYKPARAGSMYIRPLEEVSSVGERLSFGEYGKIPVYSTQQQAVSKLQTLGVRGGFVTPIEAAKTKYLEDVQVLSKIGGEQVKFTSLADIQKASRFEYEEGQTIIRGRGSVIGDKGKWEVAPSYVPAIGGAKVPSVRQVVDKMIGTSFVTSPEPSVVFTFSTISGVTPYRTISPISPSSSPISVSSFMLSPSTSSFTPSTISSILISSLISPSISISPPPSTLSSQSSPVSLLPPSPPSSSPSEVPTGLPPFLSVPIAPLPSLGKGGGGGSGAKGGMPKISGKITDLLTVSARLGKLR